MLIYADDRLPVSEPSDDRKAVLSYPCRDGGTRRAQAVLPGKADYGQDTSGDE